MTTDQVLLHRFVISQLAAAGVDRAWLLREAGIQRETLDTSEAHLPSQVFSRLWEVAEHGLDDPNVALRVADGYQLASLGLYDYLFSTMPTLGDGLATCGPYVTAVTTNHQFNLVTENTNEVSLHLDIVDYYGRGSDHTQIWGLAAALTRARRVLRTPLAPVRVKLRQQAPTHHDGFVDVFATSAIEFEAQADAMVFRAEDMQLPLTSCDPVLAGVLQPLAEALPPPPPLESAWPERVAAALSWAMDAGEVSLEQVARRLATSPRTLQRRLGEAGTTWRREVERARTVRLAETNAAGPVSRARQAELLGYAGAGSLRRAAQRWSAWSNPRQYYRAE